MRGAQTWKENWIPSCVLKWCWPYHSVSDLEWTRGVACALFLLQAVRKLRSRKVHLLTPLESRQKHLAPMSLLSSVALWGPVFISPGKRPHVPRTVSSEKKVPLVVNLKAVADYM